MKETDEQDALINALVDLLTTGKMTVSGDSLATVVPLLDHVLRRGRVISAVRYHHDQKDGGWIEIELAPAQHQLP